MLFIPIGDENPTRTRPLVTWALVAANVAVFLYANIGLSDGDLSAFFELWAFKTSEPFSVQLFTSMFMHAGIPHIFGNLLMLWILGDNVEDKVGSARFLFLYLAAGVAATWAFTLMSGATGGASVTDLPADPQSLVGASGAIAGVMGIYLVFFPEARIKMLAWFFLLVQVLYVRAKWVIGIWLALDVIRTAYAQGASFDGVATAAHLGGGLFGILVALFLKRRLGGGGEGDAWDVHTGFASRPGAHTSNRLVDRGRNSDWLASPDPSEPDLIHLEHRLVRLVEGGRMREAIDLYPRYEALSRERPLPGHVQIELAHEFFEQGLWEDALQAYERYLGTEPGGKLRGEAKFRMGILLGRSLGRPAEAVRWLREAAREHHDAALRRFASEEIVRLGG